MNELKISVVVCTYNRARYLHRCLNSLVCQKLSLSQYEIIVIDNNSTDDTKEICDLYSDFKNFRYFMETKQGLSFARNRGIYECNSQIVAFTDDDAIVTNFWLSTLVEAFNDSGVGAAGGPILPIYEREIPCWFHESLLPLFSCRNYGNRSLYLKDGIFFYGVNMAIRKDILINLGGFRTDLGRKTNCLLSDEELDFFQKIDKIGLKKRYLPNALVYHYLPKTRLNLIWLLRRYYWMGIGQGIRQKEHLISKTQIFHLLHLKLIKTLVELIKPTYRAGICTRLIPLFLLIGFFKQLLVRE